MRTSRAGRAEHAHFLCRVRSGLLAGGKAGQQPQHRTGSSQTLKSLAKSTKMHTPGTKQSVKRHLQECVGGSNFLLLLACPQVAAQMLQGGVWGTNQVSEQVNSRLRMGRT